MKCTNKRLICFVPVLAAAFFMTGCAGKEPEMAYDVNTHISSFSIESNDYDKIADSFAENLCVVSGDVETGEEIEAGSDSYGSAVLCDINSKKILYSKNATVKMYPASMTKVMTALCAMKYGNKDDILTASDNVKITEDGAQVCGIKSGDTMTLDQAMHGLLMYSGNDAAILIAEGISGSVDEFCKLMNQEAAGLGATNTNFVNPNGLHDENHYSTAYDMYLIFNEAMKYDWFTEIINMNTYSTTYKNSAGEPIDISFNTTNLFLKGDVSAPQNITVIGGKTGTTNAAGANLVLLSKDAGGNPYISVVMKASNRDVLYSKMTSLLSDIVN